MFFTSSLGASSLPFPPGLSYCDPNNGHFQASLLQLDQHEHALGTAPETLVGTECSGVLASSDACACPYLADAMLLALAPK